MNSWDFIRGFKMLCTDLRVMPKICIFFPFYGIKKCQQGRLGLNKGPVQQEHAHPILIKIQELER